MTQFSDAFARARRLTRAEKRQIPHKRPEKVSVSVNGELIFRDMLSEAIRRDVAPVLTDLGLGEPLPVQARPNTVLARPSWPATRTQAFAKTEPYHSFHSDRVVASQRRMIQKFGTPLSKNTVVQTSISSREALATSEWRLLSIAMEEDQRRAQAQAQIQEEFVLNLIRFICDF